jgi:hypothetical protein
LRRFLGYFLTLGRRQFGGSCFPALTTAKFPEFHGSRIAIIFPAVLNLACRDVSDELAKLDRVARAFEPLRHHATIVAQSERQRTAFSKSAKFQTDPLPAAQGACCQQ